MNRIVQPHTDLLMNSQHPFRSALRNRSCGRLTCATTGMNARPINCDLLNAKAAPADQRRLFLLWHQQWLYHLQEHQ